MRFMPTKTFEQLSCLMLHRTRHLFVRQQTAVINSIRAHLAEFGIVAPVGRKGVTDLLHVVADPSDKRVPEVGRACLAALGDQLLGLKRQIFEFDRMIMAWHRSNQTSKRLHYIPGVGLMLATALVASLADPGTFRSGRNFSAWIGLVPRSTPVGARTGSAASANRVTAICATCSWPVHSPSSVTPRFTEPGIGPGSRRCWHGARRRSPPLHLQTIDCAHRLGHDGQGRALQTTRRACGANEVAPDSRRDVKVGTANTT
jgi:hypothetical protein